MAALALGVGAMNAARALGSEFSRRLNGDLRQWIAADAAVTLPQAPSEEQRGEMLRLAARASPPANRSRRIPWLRRTRRPTRCWCRFAALTLRTYPWYGEVALEPREPLASALHPP